MKNIFLFTMIVCVLFTSCTSKDKPLNDAIKHIESTYSSEELEEFAKKSESDAISDAHFGYAMNFRNEVLRKPKDSTLIKYFYTLDIHHLDDMSGLVFTSLHRKLNRKPIDLESQLELLYEYWAEVEQCVNVNFKRGMNYFNKYNVNDTIQVRMPIRNNKTAIQYECPDKSNWIYNDNKDMLIRGIIEEKKKVDKDNLEIFFKLRVLSMNQDSIQILMEDIKVGDEMNVNLKHDIIEEDG